MEGRQGSGRVENLETKQDVKGTNNPPVNSHQDVVLSRSWQITSTVQMILVACKLMQIF